MIGFRAFDVFGLFVEPAVVCLAVALGLSYALRRLLDRIGINHLVWNRALFDFALLVAITAILILSIRIQGT